MATGHLNGSDSVTSLSYSPTDKRTAVGQSDGTIDLMFGGAVDQTFSDTASPITTVAYDLRNLFATDGTKNFWHLNRQDIPYSFGGAGTVDAKIFSVAQDSNPNWPGFVTGSYQTEAVPSGKFVGQFLDATAAVTAGGVVGDWYQVSSTYTYFELTDLIGGETEIFRAGGPDFPDGGLIVATATKVIIFEILNGIPTMWMVFNDSLQNMLNGTPTSVSYSDGRIYCGKTLDVNWFDFVSDESILTQDGATLIYNSTIADRNNGDGFTTINTNGIVNRTVNDVAATILTSVQTTNELSATDNPSTQSFTTLAATYTLGFDGDGSVVLSGTATDTLDGSTFPHQERQWLTFAATAGSLTLTLSGDVRNIQLEQSATPHEYVASVTGPTTGSTPSAKQLVNRTNLLTHSNDFEDADWDKALSGTGIAPVLTTGFTAPDGTATATRLVCDRGASPTDSDFSLLQQSISTADQHDASIYIKSNTGVSQNVYFRGANNTTQVATTQWTRIDADGLGSDVGNIFYCTVGARGVQSEAAIDVLIWHAQIETGTQATPYIATTDTAATVTDDTGLFVPAWGVATDGGVSAGLDSGSIFDIIGQALPPQVIDFTFDERIISQYLFSSDVGVYPVPLADTNILSFERRYFPTSNVADDLGAPRLLNDAGLAPTGGYVAAGATIAYGSDQGLTLVTEDTADYFDGVYNWITTAYQTAGMKKPDGAWLDQITISATTTHTDQSIEGNDATTDVIISGVAYGLSGLLGGDLTSATFSATVTTGGQLIGSEFVNGAWVFRRDISEFVNASETAGALTITGAPAVLLRWNAVPMTESELNKAEQEAGLIESGVLNPLATTYSLNDLRFSALRSQGYLGHTNDMLQDWLADNGAGLPIRQINDMWKDFLIAFGIPEPTYQYNDARYAFYGALGYTGTLNDREVQFWRNGGVITIGGSGSFGDAFSIAFD